MSHGYGWGRGVRKVPKKCHILFEWPLRTVVKSNSVMTNITGKKLFYIAVTENIYGVKFSQI